MKSCLLVGLDPEYGGGKILRKVGDYLPIPTLSCSLPEDSNIYQHRLQHLESRIVFIVCGCESKTASTKAIDVISFLVSLTRRISCGLRASGL